MIADRVRNAMERGGWIRDMFEQGLRLKSIHGDDAVFDFSLGSPISEPPPSFCAALQSFIDTPESGRHRYMPNAGYPATRAAIAAQLNAEYGIAFRQEHIIMSCGAGGALNVIFRALLNPDDEVLTLSPFFVEYQGYTENHGACLITVPTDEHFQPIPQAIERAITPATKIVLLNSPNNPTGAVYTQQSLQEIGAILERKQQEYGTIIYLVGDEPYRRIVFDGAVNPSVFAAHPNSLLAYSHSKDLSLAGERIGYIALHPNAHEPAELADALTYATRILGFVNAPALMQHLLPHLGFPEELLAEYQHLRDVFLGVLQKCGFQTNSPQGAFFFFPKSPIADDIAFVKKALEYNILLVPGTGFGMPGYFRIAFCCPEERIHKSYHAFLRLAQHYGLASSAI